MRWVASGVSGRSAAMVTVMAGGLQSSLVVGLSLSPVANEVTGRQPYEGEPAGEHDNADVQKRHAPAPCRHAASTIENPSDHDGADKPARVAGHGVEGQGGSPP